MGKRKDKFGGTVHYFCPVNRKTALVNGALLFLRPPLSSTLLDLILHVLFELPGPWLVEVLSLHETGSDSCKSPFGRWWAIVAVKDVYPGETLDRVREHLETRVG